MFFFGDLFKDPWISYSKTKSIWYSSLSPKKQFIEQHKLLYFKAHLEGLSKLAQAQVLLQVNETTNCIWESPQLPDINQPLSSTCTGFIHL